MVYLLGAWGVNGFYISSEDKTFFIYAKNLNINVPIQTVFENNVTTGTIKFETDNEIVIREKIVYIN